MIPVNTDGVEAANYLKFLIKFVDQWFQNRLVMGAKMQQHGVMWIILINYFFEWRIIQFWANGYRMRPKMTKTLMKMKADFWHPSFYDEVDD